MAKVSCILHHQGVQLILAYSWARPAVLAAGRGGMFNFCCVFTFIPFPLSPCPSLLSPQLSLLSLFSLSLGDDTKWPTRVDVSLNPNTINQYSDQNTYLCIHSVDWDKTAHTNTWRLVRHLSHLAWRPLKVIGKQCRPRSNAAEWGIWSQSPLFANILIIYLQEYI